MRAKTEKSDISHNDQDSDVSFESDNDEEIDAAEIEEEDWIEYIKMSTKESKRGTCTPTSQLGGAGGLNTEADASTMWLSAAIGWMVLQTDDVRVKELLL